MLRATARRVRSAVGRAGSHPPADPWPAYLAAVEPALAAEVRVHRFAAPPLIAAGSAPAARIGVWISDDDPAARERSRDAVAGGTTGPAAVLEGDLPSALQQTRAEWVALVRAGDVLSPITLQRLGQAAALAGDAAVITCDNDELGADGARERPRFRPGPSPDRWLACDDSGPLLLVKREAAAAALRELGSDPLVPHALAVMLAGRASASHAHVPLLLCHRPHGAAAPPPASAAVAAVLGRWEPDARLEDSATARRVRRSVAGEPRVEIIVCLRDRAELTQACVRSVLRETAYERLAVTLVDNGSVEPETAAMLSQLSRDPRIRVRRDDRPFNFAALNNAGAAQTGGDVLVFLNNDTEVIDPDWLTAMLEEAQRPEVGAVAPMLLFDDDTVQHAGAALGMHGYAGHPFAGLAPSASTPFGSADGGTRNWLAVTAACMMVQRDKFEAVDGFDERFVVAGNDVDLCLRLTARGHRSLCLPHVRMRHHESRSRGVHIDPGDFAASERSYGAFRTVGDPFYNPNLTLTATDCRVRGRGEVLA